MHTLTKQEQQMAYVDPRVTAMNLVDEGMVSMEDMLKACLGYMSGDDVRDMMACNDFAPDEEEAEEDEEEEEVNDELQELIDELDKLINARRLERQQREASN
jgi:NAD(P)H-dependent FMN reductase